MEKGEVEVPKHDVVKHAFSLTRYLHLTAFSNKPILNQIDSLRFRFSDMK